MGQHIVEQEQVANWATLLNISSKCNSSAPTVQFWGELFEKKIMRLSTGWHKRPSVLIEKAANGSLHLVCHQQRSHTMLRTEHYLYLGVGGKMLGKVYYLYLGV